LPGRSSLSSSIRSDHLFIMRNNSSCLRFLLLGLAISAFANHGLSQDLAPKILSKPNPEFPECLWGDWTPGRVMLKVAIDQSGKPTEVLALFANYPDFVIPAIEALKKCHFTPAKKDGQNIASIFYFLQSFGVVRNSRDSTDYSFGLSFPEQRNQVKGKRQTVVQPGVERMVTPVYPFELLLAGITGDAEADFDIDQYGRVVGVEVLSASRPEFGDSLRAMGVSCGFAAATRDGIAVSCVVRKKQHFAPGAKYLTYDSQTKQLVRTLKSAPDDIVPAERLDSLLKRLYSPAPEYPIELKQQKAEGSAVIEFLVDQHGRAQLPKVVSATKPEFGLAAAVAVQQWAFDRPTRSGKAVFARARQEFEFRPDDRYSIPK
jgi:TonB family protein